MADPLSNIGPWLRTSQRSQGTDSVSSQTKCDGRKEGCADPGTESTLSTSTCVGKDSEEAGQRARSCPGIEEVQCSICYELLLDPVVGSCGHDFCRHCYEEWKKRSHRKNCPICRKRLPNDLGVCHRLKDMIERLFPEQISERRQQLERWNAGEAEDEDCNRDADLEALMSQISHLLEDANSGAEMEGSQVPHEHVRLNRSRRDEVTRDQFAQSSSGTDTVDAHPTWVRQVRPRCSLLVNVAFTMGAFSHQRRRFRQGPTSRGRRLAAQATTSGLSGGVSWNTQQSHGEFSGSHEGIQGQGSQASGTPGGQRDQFGQQLHESGLPGGEDEGISGLSPQQFA